MESCILWHKTLNAYGYGVRKVGGRRGKVILAHREAYEKARGGIPAGMCVLHRCDTPACINPEHLFLGTRAENMADAMTKGRVPQLTARKVDGDRVRDLLAFGYSRIEIAKWLGIQPSSVYRAVPVGGARGP